jgi:hypothetical protein
MKWLNARLLTAASVLTFSICGAVAAVELKGAHEHDALANMQSILWTSGPTQIDRWRHSLERLPALAVAEAPKTNLSRVSLSLGLLRATTKDPVSKVADAAISGDVAMANGDECNSKYRSYRAEDNTYQPFDDGPRRPCESALALSHAMTQSKQSEQSVADNFDQSHVSWCRARDGSHVSGHTLDGRHRQAAVCSAQSVGTLRHRM